MHTEALFSPVTDVTSHALPTTLCPIMVTMEQVIHDSGLSAFSGAFTFLLCFYLFKGSSIFVFRTCPNKVQPIVPDVSSPSSSLFPVIANLRVLIVQGLHGPVLSG